MKIKKYTDYYQLNENNTVTNKLIDCIETTQECLNMYSNKDNMEKLQLAAESAIEASQMCLNFINRNYGPIDKIKECTKQILEIAAKDFNSFSGHDLADECSHKLSSCAKIL